MLIDSHCHIPHTKYDKSIDEILKEASQEGVSKFLSIGTSLEDNKLAIEAAEKYEEIYCSIGIYPHESKGLSCAELSKFLELDLQKSKKIKAVGECGVDMPDDEHGRTLKDQLELFEMQINFAIYHNLPIIIHNRNGKKEILNLLYTYTPKGLTGVMHCFTYDWEYAQKILNLGFYISFTNNISYPKKDELLEVVKNVPNDKFLVETDAPYLPPQNLRGQINYPKYVKMVAEKIASVKGITFEEASNNSYQNTCKLFNL